MRTSSASRADFIHLDPVHNAESSVPGLSADTSAAIGIAQERSARASSATVAYRLDLALDELLRHPGRQGEPAELVDRALAHARTKVRRRAAIAVLQSFEDVPAAQPAARAPAPIEGEIVDLETLVLEAEDVIASSSMRPRYRGLLLLALADWDADQIAAPMGVSPAQARQQLSRARGAGRAIGLLEVISA